MEGNAGTERRTIISKTEVGDKKKSVLPKRYLVNPNLKNNFIYFALGVYDNFMEKDIM